jgi:DNA-binding MarR family transcriptional regulator
MEDFNSIHALAYYNILRTSSWIEARIKKALKPFDLTHAQLNVLHLLYENHPRPLSANELKAKILVNSPDVTRLLDRLVKKGYVTRDTCEESRRKIDISITKSGEDIFLQAHQAGKKSVRNFFEEQISAEEATELRRILHKMKD